MSNKQSKSLLEMKNALLSRVEEWLGADIPDEDDEDYGIWQSKLARIDDIDSVYDLIEYLECEGADVDDFFICGERDVVSAGMDPADVSLKVVEELGQLVSEKSTDGRSVSRVYLYDKTYFVITSKVSAFAMDKQSALKAAEIGDAR